MKKILAAVAVLAALSFGNFANAGERDFTLHNHTRYNVLGMNLSSYGYPWRHVTNAYVAPGNAKEFTVYDIGTIGDSCMVQIQLIWPEGVTSSWTEGFNLCSATDVTIYEDRNGAIRAQVE